MDQELKDSLDEIRRHLSRLDAAFQQNRDEHRQTREQLQGEHQQTREQLQDEIRQAWILLERQHDDIRQVAEGVMGHTEKLEFFRAEVSDEFKHLRGLFTPSYKGLDRRVKALESWRKRTERDPVELVHERFGKPKTDTPG